MENALIRFSKNRNSFSKASALIGMSTNRDSSGVKNGLLRVTKTEIFAAWKMPKLGSAKT